MEPIKLLPVAHRAGELKRRIGNVKYEDHLGIRGLTLDLEYLASWGVDPSVLASMQHGVDLCVQAAPAKRRRNHPSCKANCELAHVEFDRLHKQGKDYMAGQRMAFEIECEPLCSDHFVS